MDEKTQALIEEYDKSRQRALRYVLLIGMIVLGAVLIISALLFRTQYPFALEDKGLIHYTYSHILLRDKTQYSPFNTVKNHEVKYYIVYRNASIYYEQETTFSIYSAHANKENVRPGITNHAVIQTSADRYTFLALDGRTYCYEKPVSKLKVLFDASYADGKIYLRFAAYAVGTALIAAGIILLVKQRKKESAKPKND